MTQSDDERRRQVLSYLREQSQKGINHMKTVVQEEWDRLWALVEGLSQAQADFKPGPDEFSVADVVRHLTLANGYYRDRIAALAQGRTIEVQSRPGMLPPEEASPFSEVMRRFQEVNKGVMAMMDGCDPSANLDPTMAHRFFGPLNWREWFVLLRMHGRDHTQQVEAIKASPRFPKA